VMNSKIKQMRLDYKMYKSGIKFLIVKVSKEKKW